MFYLYKNLENVSKNYSIFHQSWRDFQSNSMKIFKFLNLFLTIVALSEQTLHQIIENSENFSVSQAINDIIDEFYVKSQIQFDIRILRDNSCQLSFIIDSLLAKIKEQNSHFFFSNDLNLNFNSYRC